jgi:hypothetical protein
MEEGEVPLRGSVFRLRCAPSGFSKNRRESASSKRPILALLPKH